MNGMNAGSRESIYMFIVKMNEVPAIHYLSNAFILFISNI